MRAVLKAVLAISLLLAVPASAAEDPSGYAAMAPSLDGIGKSYMGREIAEVMGYQGAAWLERDEREAEEGTSGLLPLLRLKPTDVVADVGAGTGYFTFRMSKLVPQGKVYAVDIQEEMLAIIRQRKDSGEGGNVIPVLGAEKDPRLPAASVDLILLVDVYHELAFPREVGQAMVRALKPGGRIALVEYRAEDPNVTIKELHKMTEAQVRKEMAALGLAGAGTDRSLPQQHLMFFTKK